MRIGVYRNAVVGDFGLSEAFGRDAGSGYGHVKHFCYGCAYGAFIFHFVVPHHIICDNSRLAVGRSGEIIEPWFIRERMWKLDSVAYRVYV